MRDEGEGESERWGQRVEDEDHSSSLTLTFALLTNLSLTSQPRFPPPAAHRSPLSLALLTSSPPAAHRSPLTAQPRPAHLPSGCSKRVDVR